MNPIRAYFDEITLFTEFGDDYSGNAFELKLGLIHRNNIMVDILGKGFNTVEVFHKGYLVGLGYKLPAYNFPFLGKTVFEIFLTYKNTSFENEELWELSDRNIRYLSQKKERLNLQFLYGGPIFRRIDWYIGLGMNYVKVKTDVHACTLCYSEEALKAEVARFNNPHYNGTHFIPTFHMGFRVGFGLKIKKEKP